MPNVKMQLLNEWRQLSRDPLIKWMFFFPIAIALAYRWGIPELEIWLMEQWHIDFSDYSVLLLSMMPALIPSIIGMVIGFTLLDMKDDGSLSAMLVTPLQLGGYLKFKLLIPMIISAPLNMFCLWLANVMPLSFVQMVLASCSPLLLAVIFPLLLVVVAENKVQGFALSKVLNAVLFPPLLAWFFPGAWNWLFGILPSWWPMKAFWLSMDDLTTAAITIVMGYGIQILWIYVLWRWVHHKVSV